jgi:hypothetical protein
VATAWTNDDPIELDDGDASDPVARFGYRYADVPVRWREESARAGAIGDVWLLHIGPGQTLRAETERLVAGNIGCQGAIGALLRVVAEDTEPFSASRAKYFVAERVAGAMTPRPRAPTPLGGVATPATAQFRERVETVLSGLLDRELPKVLTDSASELERMGASPVKEHQAWAREGRRVDQAMKLRQGSLRYDIQSFRLSPDSDRLHFVRAEWLVGDRQGFALSAWLKGDALDIVSANLAPASWLRMFEFNGHVMREQLGLVLNVFDRNRDGWGEVLMEQSGYESTSLTVLDYSSGGFQPAGIELSGGC